MTKNDVESNDEIIERYIPIISQYGDKTITLQINYGSIYMHVYSVYSDDVDFVRSEKVTEEHLVHTIVLSLDDSSSNKFSNMKIIYSRIWKEILINSFLHGHHVSKNDIENCDKCNMFMIMKL